MQLPVLGHRAEAGPVVPLQFNRELCSTTEDIDFCIDTTLQTEYVPFNDYIQSEKGVVSICGSGPSLAKTYKDLRGDVFAINASHGWLLEHGVVPKYTMLWDADPVVSKFAIRHPDTTYLVASRCHPSVFKALEGLNVVVWHANGDVHIQKFLEKYNKNEPMCGGGGAGVTRAMYVVRALGYLEEHIFGGDSSFSEEFTHVKKSVVPEKEMQVMVHDANGERRWFKTTPWLADQAEDFKVVAPALKNTGSKIVVHGDGLIPCIAEYLGFDVDTQSQTFKHYRQFRDTAKLIWRHL